MNQERFSLSQIVSVMAIAIFNGIMPAVQPILLGALVSENRLTVQQLGQAATLEGLGMVIASTVAAIFFSPDHLRRKIAPTIFLAVSANLLTVFLPATGILLARFVHGITAGILFWGCTGMFSRLSNPIRLFAIFTTLTAAGAFVLAGVISAYILPAFGSAGAYVLFAMVNFSLFATVPFLPKSYSPLGISSRFLKPTIMGLCALVVAACYLGGIMAFWVYVVPIGQVRGFDSHTLNTMVSVAIGVRIAGGLCASLFGPHINMRFLNIGAGIFCALLVILAYRVNSLPILYVIISVFCFMWMLIPAFHMPLIIEADPSRRSGIFVGTAHFSGVFVGPMLSSLVVTDVNFRGAVTVSAGLFLISSALAALCVFLARSERLKLRCSES